MDAASIVLSRVVEDAPCRRASVSPSPEHEHEGSRTRREPVSIRDQGRCECSPRDPGHGWRSSSDARGTLRDRSPRGAGMTVDLSDARDRDLVRRIGRGDGDAFRGLFGRYAPSALALARRVVRQPFLAEEIVQEAFLAVWKNPGGYDDRRGSVRSWLHGHGAPPCRRRRPARGVAAAPGRGGAGERAGRHARPRRAGRRGARRSPRSAAPFAPRSTSCPRSSAR